MNNIGEVRCTEQVDATKGVRRCTRFCVYEISTTVKLERPEKHSGHPLILWPDSLTFARSPFRSCPPGSVSLEVRRTRKTGKQEEEEKKKKSAEFRRESKGNSFLADHRIQLARREPTKDSRTRVGERGKPEGDHAPVDIH